MTYQEISERFAELAGIPFHILFYDYEKRQWLCPCTIKPITFEETVNHYNLDFCDDPRLVLEVMMKREDWSEFISSVGIVHNGILPYDEHEGAYFYIDFEFMINTTGLLALKAIEWMEEKEI
jgi:hypothetical protein